MMPWNLVTELATEVGWVQSQVTKQQTFEARNVAFVERTCYFIGNKNISSLFQNCASEYLQHSALR